MQGCALKTEHVGYRAFKDDGRDARGLLETATSPTRRCQAV